MKLCEYYNCKAMVENSRVSIIRFFEDRKKQHLLFHKPRIASDNNRTNFNSYGAPTSEKMIHHQLDLISEYVEDYCQEIWFVDLLQELLNYNYAKKTKYDLVAAFAMALLADEELAGRDPVEEAPRNTWRDVGFYIDSNGYKRYGIIERTEPMIKMRLENTDDNLLYNTRGLWQQ